MLTILALLTLFVTSYSVPITAQSSSTPKEWLQLKHAGWQSEIDERYDDATRSYEKALLVAEKLSPFCPQVEETLVRLANVAILRGNLDLADKYYFRLLHVVNTNKKHGKLDREALVWLEDLADTYEIIGAKFEPMRALQHAADIRALTNNPKLKGTLESLIRIHVSRGEMELAYDLVKKCIKIDRALPPSEGRDMALACNLTLLASMEVEHNKLNEAEQAATEALAIIVKAKKDRRQFLAESGCRTAHASILISRGDYEKAEKELTIAGPLLTSAGVAGTYVEGPYFMTRARLALKERKPKVAQQWLEKNIFLIEKNPAVLTEKTKKLLATAFDELKGLGQADASNKMKKSIAALLKRSQAASKTTITKEARAAK